MANGYKSPLPLPLGIGVPVDAARGNAPLPFIVGVPSIGIDAGMGYGPLPFIYGVPVAVSYPVSDGPGTTQRRRYQEYPKYYKDGELLEYLEALKRKQILRDDEEFLELLTMILKSGILE